MIAKFNKTKSLLSVEWGLGHPKYLIIYKKSVRNERVKKVLDPVLASVAVIMIGYRGPTPSVDPERTIKRCYLYLSGMGPQVFCSRSPRQGKALSEY